MNALIDEYEKGYERVREATQGLSEQLLNYRPSEGAWNIREIVVHLCDAELVGIHRMKAVIAEQNPLMIAFDQDLWTSRLKYATLDHEFYLQLFRMLRESMAAVLRSLAPDDWNRSGIHNVAGKLTLKDIVENYIEHVNAHLKQIERNKKAFAERG